MFEHLIILPSQYQYQIGSNFCDIYLKVPCTSAKGFVWRLYTLKRDTLKKSALKNFGFLTFNPTVCVILVPMWGNTTIATRLTVLIAFLA